MAKSIRVKYLPPTANRPARYSAKCYGWPNLIRSEGVLKDNVWKGKARNLNGDICRHPTDEEIIKNLAFMMWFRADPVGYIEGTRKRPAFHVTMLPDDTWCVVMLDDMDIEAAQQELAGVTPSMHQADVLNAIDIGGDNNRRAARSTTPDNVRED